MHPTSSFYPIFPLPDVSLFSFLGKDTWFISGHTAHTVHCWPWPLCCGSSTRSAYDLKSFVYRVALTHTGCYMRDVAESRLLPAFRECSLSCHAPTSPQQSSVQKKTLLLVSLMLNLFGDHVKITRVDGGSIGGMVLN